MINETKHFILTHLEGKDCCGHIFNCNITNGAKIQIKNVDGTTETLLYINYATGHGCSLTIPGSKLQDYITSWDLFVELVMLLDEAYDRITFANSIKDFSKGLD